MQDQEKPEISVSDEGKLPSKGEATSSEEGNNSSKREVSSKTNKNRKKVNKAKRV